MIQWQGCCVTCMRVYNATGKGHRMDDMGEVGEVRDRRLTNKMWLTWGASGK